MTSQVFEIGKTDTFERKYMGKFRALVAKHGEFVAYERDRGARDIGLHLTQASSLGNERMTSAFCWFQMKGIMDTTLSEKDLEAANDISISLAVQHLKYWYLQPIPTYLVIYVESINKFLISNIQKYVSTEWGNDIFTLKQKTTTVRVSKESELDDQAFDLILNRSDVEQWAKVLEADEVDVKLCRRDCGLIWHFGTAVDRNVEHCFFMLDWISKTRGELYVHEKLLGAFEDDHTVLRQHWQYQMDISQLEDVYPYLEFHGNYEEEDQSWCDDSIKITFSNGSIAKGVNNANEYFEFKFGATLNELGGELFESVKLLVDIGLLEIIRGKSELVSVAPWHSRSV